MSPPGERGNDEAQRGLDLSAPSLTAAGRRIHAASPLPDVTPAPMILEEASQASPANLALYQNSSFPPQNVAAGLLWTHQQQQQQHQQQQQQRAPYAYYQSAMTDQATGLSSITEQLPTQLALLQSRQVHTSAPLLQASTRPEWPLSPSADAHRTATASAYPASSQSTLPQDVASIWRQFQVHDVPSGSRAYMPDTASAERILPDGVVGIEMNVANEQQGASNAGSRPWRAQGTQVGSLIPSAPVTGLGFYGMPEPVWHSPYPDTNSFHPPPSSSPGAEQAAGAFTASSSQRWSGSPVEQWTSAGVSPPTLDLSSALYTQADDNAGGTTSRGQSGSAAPVRSKSGRRAGRRARAPTMSAISSSSSPQVDGDSHSRSLRRFSTIGTSSLSQRDASSAPSGSPDMTRRSTDTLSIHGSPNAGVGSGTAFFNESDKRASIACVLCRKRKLRCDQGEPCRQCERRGLRCEYALTQSQMDRVDEPTQPSSSATTSSNSSKGHSRRKSITGRPTLGDVVQRSAATMLSPTLGARASQGSFGSPNPAPGGAFSPIEIAPSRTDQLTSGTSVVGAVTAAAGTTPSSGTSPSDAQVPYFGRGQGTAMNNIYIGGNPTSGNLREQNDGTRSFSTLKVQDSPCSLRALGLTLPSRCEVAERMSPQMIAAAIPASSNEVHSALPRVWTALQEALAVSELGRMSNPARFPARDRMTRSAMAPAIVPSIASI